MLMSFFDDPIEYCRAQRRFVSLDQAKRSCARREGCKAGLECPLERLFRRTPAPRQRPPQDELGWE